MNVVERLWSRTATLAVLCAVGLAAPASAYRPPARALLSNGQHKHFDRAVRTLRVEAETVQFGADGSPRGAPMTERRIYMAPGSARTELDDPAGTRVEIRADDKLVVRAGKEPERVTRAPADVFIDAITAGPPLDPDRSIDRLLRDMRALNVNTDVVSLARFDGRVAFLIGSKPWETDKGQVWIDKDTLVVVRVVFFARADKAADKDPKPSADVKPGSKVDARYLGWGSSVGGLWYPASEEIYVDDKLVRRTLVKTVEKGVPVDAGLFR